MQAHALCRNGPALHQHPQQRHTIKVSCCFVSHTGILTSVGEVLIGGKKGEVCGGAPLQQQLHVSQRVCVEGGGQKTGTPFHRRIQSRAKEPELGRCTCALTLEKLPSCGCKATERRHRSNPKRRRQVKQLHHTTLTSPSLSQLVPRSSASSPCTKAHGRTITYSSSLSGN